MDRQGRSTSDLPDGGSVSGATSSALTIDPLTISDSGSYDCRVEDPCVPMQTAVSITASLTVVDRPGSATNLALQKTNGGANLHLAWTDTDHADDYVVLEDPSPGGAFSTQTGTTMSGAAGLTVTMPAGNVFYLAVGRNPVCGLGPGD